MISGRPYQEITAREVLPALWRQGKRAPLLVAPVGAGKSRIAAMVAEDRLARGTADFWLLAHRRELIQQFYHWLRAFGLPATAILAGQDVDHTSNCRVASMQTLARRALRPARRIAVIGIDEAHRVVGPSYLTLLQRFREEYEQVWCFGLTATPYRLDGKSLGHFADALYEVTTPRDLIESSVLVDPAVMGLAEPDLRGVGIRAGDYVQEDLAARVCKPSLVGDVVEGWVKHAEGAPTVLFAASIAHSEMIRDRFLARGVRVAHLDGTTPTETRSRLLARLAIGGQASDHPEALDVICNVDVLREGWDSESDYQRVLSDPTLWLGKSYPPDYRPLQVLSDCAPTESTCVYRQREGRVCRSYAPDAPGNVSPGKHQKRWARILSHSGNWRRHGFLVDHCGFSLDQEKYIRKSSQRAAAAQALHCQECLCAWPEGTVLCGFCGAMLQKKREFPREDSSKDLKYITRDEAASRGQLVPPPDPNLERNQLIMMWHTYKKICERRRERGEPPAKDFMVSMMFKKRFGRLPSRDVLAAARTIAYSSVKKASGD